MMDHNEGRWEDNFHETWSTFASSVYQHNIHSHGLCRYEEKRNFRWKNVAKSTVQWCAHAPTCPFLYKYETFYMVLTDCICNPFWTSKSKKKLFLGLHFFQKICHGRQRSKKGVKTAMTTLFFHFLTVMSCHRLSLSTLHSRNTIPKVTRWSWTRFYRYFVVENIFTCSYLPNIQKWFTKVSQWRVFSGIIFDFILKQIWFPDAKST